MSVSPHNHPEELLINLRPALMLHYVLNQVVGKGEVLVIYGDFKQKI